MSTVSVILMKLIRKIKNPLSNWYRTAEFKSGLKKCGDGLSISGGGVQLWCDNVIAGDGVHIYPNVVLWGPGKIFLGDHTEIGIGSVIYSDEKIEIGNNNLIAAHCYIIDSNHGIAKDDLIMNQKSIVKGPVVIEDDVWLGAGVKVLSGVHIGQGAVIGAQSLVNKNIPPYAIAAGVPAKVIGYRK